MGLLSKLGSAAGGWSSVSMTWIALGGAGLFLTTVPGCTTGLVIPLVSLTDDFIEMSKGVQ